MTSLSIHSDSSSDVSDFDDSDTDEDNEEMYRSDDYSSATYFRVLVPTCTWKWFIGNHYLHIIIIECVIWKIIVHCMYMFY